MAKTIKTSSKANNNNKKTIKKAAGSSLSKVSTSISSKAKLTRFSYFDPGAHQVSVAGDFNNWAQDSCLLKRKDSGEWNVSLNLKPGIYDYRFIVDGEWREDPQSLERVPNPFGTLNNRIVVK